jgi:hypothetical protein
MQIFEITSPFSDQKFPVFINRGKYREGRPSLMLLDAEDGCPYAIASVNMPEVNLEDDEIIVKNYSENVGMFEFLTENNIVTPTGAYVGTGFACMPVAKINPESEWRSKTQLHDRSH